MNNLQAMTSIKTKLLGNDVHFKHLVEDSQHPIIVVSEERIQYVNQAASDLPGISHADLMGSHYLVNIYEDDKVRVKENYEKQMAGSGPQFLEEFRVIRKNGSARWFTAKSSTTNWNNNVAILYILTEVTGKVLATQKRTKEQNRNQLLLHLFEKEGQMTEHELFKSVIDGCVEFTNSTVGFLHIYDVEKEQEVKTIWNDYALQTCHINEKSVVASGHSLSWSQLAQNQKPMIVNKYSDLSGTSHMPEGHIGIARFLSVPVFYEGNMRYLLGLGNKPDDYDGDDLDNVILVSKELEKILYKRMLTMQEQEQREKLLASELRYRSFAENFNGIVYRYFKDQPLDFRHGQTEQITGYCNEDFETGRVKYTDILFPEDQVRYMEEINQFENSEENSSKLTYRIISKNGKVRWVKESLKKFKEADRIGIDGFIQDITEEVIAQHKNDFQGKVLENLNEGVVLVGVEDSRIVFSNKQFCTLYGFPSQDLVGEIIFDLLEIEKGEILTSDDRWLEEGRGIRSDGSKFDVRVRGQLYDHPEFGKMVIMLHEDISTIKNAEREIAETTRHLDAIQTNAPVNFWIFKVEGKGKFYFQYQNEKATENIQVSSELLIGKELGELPVEVIPSVEMEDLRRRFKKVVQSRKPSHTRGPLHINNKAFWWSGVYSPILNEDGEVVQILVSSIPIDEQIRKETELAQANQKYSSLIENLDRGLTMLEIVCNEKGKIVDSRILLINEKMEQITGLKKQHTQGRLFSEVFPGLHEKWLGTFDKVIQTGESVVFEEFWARFEAYFEVTLYRYLPGQFAVLLSDITERKNAENLLRKSEERFDLAMKAANDGLWDWNLINNDIFYSPRFKAILGYTDEELPNELSVWKDLTDEEGREKAWKMLEDVRLGVQQRYSTEFRMRHKKGHWVDILSRANMVFDDKGTPIRVVGTCQDISGRKEYEKELKQAKLNAEQSDRLKSAFLANMSHEIRTPMNGILGFMDLLEDTTITSVEREQFISIIKSSGARLLNTINDIIELSKIEAGEMPMRITRQSVVDNLQQLKEFFDLEAGKKGIQIVLDAENLVLKTDYSKLDSILTNLIKNAIKFTHSGKIQISCKHQKESVLFEVKDTGIGIPKDRLDHIFERFNQANISKSRSYEGSGLGLAISKAYAIMLGGDIWVESEEGKGSSFYFTINCEVTNAHSSLGEGAVPETLHQDAKQTEVLIAEDDEMSYALLETILSNKNMKVYRAHNGKQAIEILQSYPDIAIVFMDMKMPEMDGLTATRKIRMWNPGIPIIAQTAFALLGDKERALEAGCTDYITKPIKQQQIYYILEQYIKLVHLDKSASYN